MSAWAFVPTLHWAEGAGLAVDNGIVVDEHMRASAPNVFAAGDVANYPDPIFEKRRRVEHWGHAEYSGQVAGANMAGEEMRYDLLTYVWSDIFDLHLEAAGDEGESDTSVVRGDMDAGSFTVLYLKENRMTAYFSVNTLPGSSPSSSGSSGGRRTSRAGSTICGIPASTRGSC